MLVSRKPSKENESFAQLISCVFSSFNYLMQILGNFTFFLPVKSRLDSNSCTHSHLEAAQSSHSVICHRAAESLSDANAAYSPPESVLLVKVLDVQPFSLKVVSLLKSLLI